MFGADAEALRSSLESATDPRAAHRDIRSCLEAMGPAFVAFGRYLSARIDLLPFTLCQELGTLPDYAEPAPPDTVCAIFERESGVSPDRAFLQFEPRPFESRLFWQAHSAVLGGSPVVVRVMRPEIAQWIEDAEDVLLLDETFEAVGLKPVHFREAAADFLRELNSRATLESDLTAFAALQRNGNRPESAAAPELHRHLCTLHVAVYRSYREIAGGVPPSPEQARLLALAWLQQALDGDTFPVEPHPGNLGVSWDGRAVFGAGPFATLPDKHRQHLGEYLAAMAARNLGEAYPHFAAAVCRKGESQDRELRRRFLQMVPFRDGFRSAGEVPQFAEEILVHWKLARQHTQPDESVTAFYRGLFHIVRTTAVMAPGRDALLEALYDLRLRNAFGKAKGMFQPAEIAGLMEQYATAFLTSPENMNRLLSGFLAGTYPPRDAGREQRRNTDGDRRAAGMALLLALGAVTLLLHKFAAAARSPALDGALALLLVAFGAAVLCIGSR